MKTLLLVVGIVSYVVCAIFLLLAGLSLFGYYNVMDGSPELYDALRHRMIVDLVIGLALAAVGTVCVIVRAKV